jgi:hypothetical protein
MDLMRLDTPTLLAGPNRDFDFHRRLEYSASESDFEFESKSEPESSLMGLPTESELSNPYRPGY